MRKFFLTSSVFLMFFILAGCQKETVITSEAGSQEKDRENLEVPFTSQAPEENWNEPWQNACEETAIVMVNAFYKEDELNLEEAKKKILEVYNAKKDQIQVSKDESVDTIVEMINRLELSFHAQAVSNPTHADLIGEIDAGRPVILPVFAPELKNPYYGEEGPDYHVIVLVGYDEHKKVFIVNDPGTEKGQGLEFSYEVLMEAIHDLDPKNYQEGEKKVVFTESQP